MYWLENTVKKGEKVTEVSSADMLEKIQGLVKFKYLKKKTLCIFEKLIFKYLREDPLFRGLSFDSISAVGPHAADIHFSTNIEENQDINKLSIYLLDAGAQYV
jgi:Xaa-Pro aminopeptidase